MRWLVGRVIGAAIAAWLTLTLAFVGLWLIPGDAIEARILLGGGDAADVAAYRQRLGLDAPVAVQYALYLGNFVRGDLGQSLQDGQSVSGKIAAQLWPTVSLAMAALVVAVMWGIVVGWASVVRLGYGLTSIAKLLVTLSLSVPVYWSGTLIILVFTVWLGLLPSGGGGRFSQLLMPMTVLGFHTSGAIARVVSSTLRDNVSADYIRTARGKGLSERDVFLRHILPNLAPPLLSIIGLQAGFLLSGTVITESIFTRPGLGRLLLESVGWQDYPVVLGIVGWSALVYVCWNVLVDVFTLAVDPRISI